MKEARWPLMSLSEILRPASGWKVDHAILSTYSADLGTLVTALISLSGVSLDHRLKGTRVELVKALESLKGRARILAQAGRIALPSGKHSILGLLDQFLVEITANELTHSWHPKAALVRYSPIDDAKEFQWRIWIGSKNLTRTMNWEVGLLIVSRLDGRGVSVEGVAGLGVTLASKANLQGLTANDVRRELSGVTWDCPDGTKVLEVRLLGPDHGRGLPPGMAEATDVCLVSPFLDSKTVAAIGQWGQEKARRTILSTRPALNGVAASHPNAFDKLFEILVCESPDVFAVGSEPLLDKSPEAAEIAEGEDVPISGLHAKLFYAAKGGDRRLWLGSANATGRAWDGRNFEIVAELRLSSSVAKALLDFIRDGLKYLPVAQDLEDIDEEVLEAARKTLCGTWRPTQRLVGESVVVSAADAPERVAPSIRMEVGAFNQAWTPWPGGAVEVALPVVPLEQRTNFIQVRLILGEKACSWVQLAPYTPPLDDSRNHAAIARYLTPHAFALWIRSILEKDALSTGGEDWDTPNENKPPPWPTGNLKDAPSEWPTVEEILGAWARDPQSFLEANAKVVTYALELEKRAVESGSAHDAQLVRDFRESWSALAAELAVAVL